VLECWESGPAPAAHGALTFNEFMPKAGKGPYDDLIPKKKGKGKYGDIPFGFTRGPPAAGPPGMKPVTAADLPKPPVNAASNPSASPTLADSNAPKPDAKTEPEVVTVKYRGPVSLAPFKCDAITRSSFIERVCYDAANSYMLIDLSGTWYHYCEIDADTVSNLMAADSMGRFYNQSIKGRFDCRTHRVPHY
jgi:KTSC domain